MGTKDTPCPHETRVRATLNEESTATDDDKAWEWMEAHVAGCEACARLAETYDAPLDARECEALDVFVQEERVWRSTCPPVEALLADVRARRAPGPDSPVALVRAHLGWCEPCKDERAALARGERVERRVPRLELPALEQPGHGLRILPGGGTSADASHLDDRLAATSAPAFALGQRLAARSADDTVRPPAALEVYLRVGHAAVTEPGRPAYEVFSDPARPGEFRLLRLDDRCPRPRNRRGVLVGESSGQHSWRVSLDIGPTGAFRLDSPERDALEQARAAPGATFRIELEGGAS